MGTTSFTERGLALVRNGYRIVPIKRGEKRPIIDAWQNLHATEKDVLRWGSNGYEHGNIGIITGVDIGMDVDILDAPFAIQMQAFIENEVGTGPVRIGLAPKRLLLYHTSEPFRKIVSPVYLSPDGKKHKIEVLAEGQQFVAFGIHPDTHKDFIWTTNNTPLNTLPDALPSITHTQAERVIDKFIEEAELRGWQRWSGERKTPQSKQKTRTEPVPTSNWYHVAGLLGDISPELPRGPAGEAGATWMGVVMGVHSALEGSREGLELCHRWSAEDPRQGQYDERDLDRQWLSLDRREIANPITLLSLEKWARDARTKKLLSSGVLDDLEDDQHDGLEFEVPPVDERQPGEGISLREIVTGGIHAPPYLIYEFMPRAVKGQQESVCTLYAQYGAGKSFVACMIAFVVAGGRHWRVEGDVDHHGPVYYYAAENQLGVEIAFAGLAAHYNRSDLPIAVSKTPFDLSNADGIAAFFVDIKLMVKRHFNSKRPALIVIDTQSASKLLLDENDTPAATEAIAKLNEWSRNYGITFLVIAHAGKDLSAGIRGSSAQPSNVAATYAVRVDDKPTRLGTIEVQKVKNGPMGMQWPFRLDIVRLGLDDKDRPITTCVAEWREASPKRATPGAMTREDVLKVKPELITVYDGIQEFREVNGGCSQANLDAVYDYVKNKLPAPPRKTSSGKRLTDNRRRAVERATTKLLDSGKEGGKYAFVNFYLSDEGSVLVWNDGF